MITWDEFVEKYNLDRYNLDYLRENQDRVLELAWNHLRLSMTAVGLALLIAIPISLLVIRFRVLSLPVFSVLGAIYTIPSLAFLSFLIPIVGLGRSNALIVLVAYAQVFLVRNIVAGLLGVESAMLEAAQGIGMNAWQVLYKVRWPLALPVVLAGFRIALVTTIGLATITDAVGVDGLGRLLFEGVSRNQPPRILAGTIAITALAVLVDLTLRVATTMTAASRARRSLRGT